jgi:hypothetical protein
MRIPSSTKTRGALQLDLAQTKSDRCREELEAGNQFAIDFSLGLNSVLQHPKVVADLTVNGRVKLSVGLQFVSKSNIEK